MKFFILLIFTTLTLTGVPYIESLKQELEMVNQEIMDQQNLMEASRIKLENLNTIANQTNHDHTQTHQVSLDIIAAVYLLLQAPPILVMTSDHGSLNHLLLIGTLKANFNRLQQAKLPLQLSVSQVQEAILVIGQDILDLNTRIKNLEERKAGLEKEIMAEEDKAHEIDHHISLSFEKGVLKRPVKGKMIKTEDQIYKNGMRFQADSKEIVKSPIEGKIEFVGEFDNFGKLVIIEVSQRMRIVLAGLGDVSVLVGDKIMASSPLGKMPTGSMPSFLYLEIRQDGQAIQPELKFLD